MTNGPEGSGDAQGDDAGVVAVLELQEELAVVSRHVKAVATVRVATTTSVREQQVRETLSRENVEIERVPVGRVVEATPEIRQEGDVTIIPVMEEVLVFERRFVLKEEVRIRRIRTTELHRETVQLRCQEATVTRSEASFATLDAIETDIQTTDSRERQLP